MAPLDGVSTAQASLIGLPSLVALPDARVLLTDSGEAYDALEQIAPRKDGELLNPIVCVDGGMALVNLQPLTGRRVLFWSDLPFSAVWRHPNNHAFLRRLIAVAAEVLLFLPPDTDDAISPQMALERGQIKHLAEWLKPRCRPANELAVDDSASPPPQPTPPPADEPLEREPPTPAVNRVVFTQPDALPAPLDLFTRQPLPTLQANHLPTTLARYVFDQSAIIGSDPGILAIASLVTCAACIHDGVKLQARRKDPSWRESARLWGAFVGDPSVKKSPAVARAVSHAKRIDMEWRRESQQQAAAHAQEAKIHKAHERKFIADRAAGRQAGTLHAAPEPPPLRRLIAEDATVEALGVVLKDNPRGVLVVQDELSGWFGAMDAYKAGSGGKDRALWLEAYNGGPKAVDRITRESIIVPNWSVSMCGGIQPSAMRAIAAKLPEDGLLQRFMLVVAQDQAGIGDDREPDRAAVDEYRHCLDWLVMTQAQEDAIRMSDEALEVSKAMQTELKAIRAVAGLSDRLNAHIGKWDGLFHRLCLTYHCIDSAAQRLQQPAPVISGPTARSVWAFLSEYLWPHAIAFYDMLDDVDRWEHARWVARFVLSRQLDEVSNRDILRGYRAWGSLSEWTRIDAIHILEDGGWLFPDYGDRAGRRVSHWAVNPRAHDLFGDIAQQESARRATAREQIKGGALLKALAKPRTERAT